VVTRGKLEELTLDLTERTIQICRLTMEDAGIKPRDLAEVVLVGGMTRMPKVQELVAEFFGREPCKGVHPDEVVAMGAAIQGAALIDAAAAPDMLLLDVTPHSLGIMVAGGYFHRLIDRNTTVPTSKSHVFTTVRDDQTSVKIVVFQGESDRAEENELLGEFVLSGLRKAPKGDVEVEVTFEISADGIVGVAARDTETGTEQHITVTATSGLTEAEIERMANENQEFLVSSRAEEEVEKERQRIEKLVHEAESLLPKVEEVLSGTPFGQDSLDNVRLILDDARAAVERRDAAALEQVAEPLERTLNMFRGVVDSARLRSP
jgi:molecular chaperone DnaK